MKQSIAASPARVWNQKNLPSNIQPFEGGTAGKIMEKLPSAVAGFARQRLGMVMLALAALGTLGLLWHFSRND